MSALNELRLSDVMPFGKHKGQEIEDLIHDHPDYLAWCVNEEVVNFDEEVINQLSERKII